MKAPRQKLARMLENFFSLIFKLDFVEHGPKHIVLLIYEEIKKGEKKLQFYYWTLCSEKVKKKNKKYKKW